MNVEKDFYGFINSWIQWMSEELIKINENTRPTFKMFMLETTFQFLIIVLFMKNIEILIQTL